MAGIIQADNLVKKYTMGDTVVEALRGVSLEVKLGEFLVIMGASGSGKSTLMHIMGCLDHPTSGTLTVDGDDISKVSDNRLAEVRNRKIGFVFQKFNLLARTTALTNVELPLLYAGTGAIERHRRATEALNNVGLGHRLGHYPSQLSGGEQQRVAIARALINNPQIIMADEPTGNLDTRSGIEIMTILQELNGKGITLVLVTHEHELAEHGDRIVMLRDGAIVGQEAITEKRNTTNMRPNIEGERLASGAGGSQS
ncbi:MAG TPA: ABC transporter ATP-binding protein [Candidatus Anoxymicrobiaceae bacterium]|jgi:putative ABC transport system ATP-binding protein